MSEAIDVSELYPLQRQLDERIQEAHGVSYENTRKERILALLVELGEFANETRCFKFWSLKGPSPKEVILDEYADGLHFLLSLGLCLGIHSYSHEAKSTKGLTEAILAAYALASKLSEDFSVENYRAAFGGFLDIAPLLGIGEKEIKEAYFKKLGVNYRRQETNY